MAWKGLLQAGDVPVRAPWLGGRTLMSGIRTWRIEGRLPREHGWYGFRASGRKAWIEGPSDPVPESLADKVRGYLVGDRIVADGVRMDPDPAGILSVSEQVFLLDLGLERFARVVAGRASSGGPLIYECADFPVGPESEVESAFLSRRPSVADVAGVTPALDAAFRLESLQRQQAERRREELERIRREDEERARQEELRQDVARRLGDGAGRRELAKSDFEAAARAALAVGGAELVDWRQSTNKDERVVTYLLDQRRYQCVCDVGLHIVEAGICLVDYRTQERGDGRFTLESLPDVVKVARDTGVLHVTRIVDDYGQDEDTDW